MALWRSALWLAAVLAAVIGAAHRGGNAGAARYCNIAVVWCNLFSAMPRAINSVLLIVAILCASWLDAVK